MSRLRRAVAAATFALVGAASVVSLAPPGQGAPMSGGRPEPRIVNGWDIASGELPYLVGVLRGFGICGGALTTPHTVVTAAHCVAVEGGSAALAPGAFRITFGGTGSNARVARVAAVAVHPGFDWSTLTNDIAVLTLSEPVTDVRFVQLLTPEESAVHLAPWTTLLVAGWGATDAAITRYPLTAQGAHVQLFPDDACGGGRAYQLYDFVWQGIDVDPALRVCAAGQFYGDRIHTCAGDSGGPLILQSRPLGARLVGVVSGGVSPAGMPSGCGYDFVDFYTRVSAYYGWLSANGAASAQPWTPPSTTPTPGAGGTGDQGGGTDAAVPTFELLSATVSQWPRMRQVVVVVRCPNAQYFSAHAKLTSRSGKVFWKARFRGTVSAQHGTGVEGGRAFGGPPPEKGFRLRVWNARCWSDDSGGEVGPRRYEFSTRCHGFRPEDKYGDDLCEILYEPDRDLAVPSRS